MVKPMDVKEIEKLMSGFKPTPELDKIFAQGLVDGHVDLDRVDELVKAGYITKKEDGSLDITKVAVDYCKKAMPKEADVMRERCMEADRVERKKREKQKIVDDKQHDRELAEALVEQGLLVVRDGKYYNTPEGFKEAFHWFRFELGQALQGHHIHWNYGNTELHSRCGDFEGVPVSQPWRYHDNVLVIKGEFKLIKKRIVESLSDEERDLFGLPPKSNRLNRPAAAAKNKLLEVLTRFQEGAASDVITTAKYIKGGEQCQKASRKRGDA